MSSFKKFNIISTELAWQWRHGSVDHTAIALSSSGDKKNVNIVSREQRRFADKRHVHVASCSKDRFWWMAREHTRRRVELRQCGKMWLSKSPTHTPALRSLGGTTSGVGRHRTNFVLFALCPSFWYSLVVFSWECTGRENFQSLPTKLCSPVAWCRSLAASSCVLWPISATPAV